MGHTDRRPEKRNRKKSEMRTKSDFRHNKITVSKYVSSYTFYIFGTPSKGTVLTHRSFGYTEYYGKRTELKDT